MKRRSLRVLLLSAVFLATPMASAYAADTATPSAHPSSSPKAEKQLLTQAQKDALAAARSTFSAAKVNAQNGFDRALADAQAIRDQAIAAAGSDQNAIHAARKSFKESYKIILDAYRFDLKNAKANFLSALNAAKIHIKNS